MQVSQVKPLADAFRENIETVIVGKREVIDIVLATLFAGGHALLEDVPGTGKTVLARALAKIHGRGFSPHPVYAGPAALGRDGASAYSATQTGDFELPAGAGVYAMSCWPTRSTAPRPAPSRALLECMEERQVTDGRRRPSRCPSPSSCWRRRTPWRSQGTFPLPEAQLDRFMVQAAPGLSHPRGAERDFAPLHAGQAAGAPGARGGGRGRPCGAAGRDLRARAGRPAALHRRDLRKDARAGGRAAGRKPPRGARADARQPELRRRLRPGLRHPGGREAHGGPGARAPAHPAQRPSARAAAGKRPCRRCWTRCAFPRNRTRNRRGAA